MATINIYFLDLCHVVLVVIVLVPHGDDGDGLASVVRVVASFDHLRVLLE